MMMSALLKQECLQPLAKGCDRRWWLDMDRQSVPDDFGCNRKRATANGFQTIWRNEQLECRMMTKDSTTWQVWYRNELIQINAMAPCHVARDMPSAPVWSSPVPGDVASVISRGHRSRGRSDRTSCSVKNGLEASLKIGRKTDKYEQARRACESELRPC